MVDVEKLYNHKILRLRYASAYFKAIAKIQAKQVNGYSNREYELTSEENEALRCYLNDNSKVDYQDRKVR